MSSKNKLEKDNIKFLLCYVPLVAFVLFFIEKNKSKQLMKHIKYWAILFIIYILSKALLGFIIWWLITTLYLLISIYLWYKAYNWEKIEIEYLDKLEWKIKNSMNSK